MLQRLLRTTTKKNPPQSILTRTPQNISLFGTSSSQWFRRFLSPKEEKQLYMGITSLFREKLKEHSTASNQSYTNMIDQVILGTQSTCTGGFDHTRLTLQQLGQLKQDLDAAGKANDLSQLKTLWNQIQQAGQQIPTTMYNRLIRGFLSCPTPQGLAMAKLVVDKMQAQHRLPTTRTCTYMIQAQLKRQSLDEARTYVAMLHHYSLNKLRTRFDCGVMLSYYVACGNAHAIDFLWQDILRHVDVIQPGPALYTQYVEWLLSSHASVDLVADAARSLVKRFGDAPVSWPDHQVATWLNVVRLLAHTKDGSDAEKLMLCLVNATDSIGTSDILTTSTDTSSIWALTRIQGKQAIQDIISKYLVQAQDLKVLEFYYRLRKSGVNEEAFDSDLKMTIGRVERNLFGSKAMTGDPSLVSI